MLTCFEIRLTSFEKSPTQLINGYPGVQCYASLVVFPCFVGPSVKWEQAESAQPCLTLEAKDSVM